MHRLFVALRPPAAIRALLIAAMGGVAGARWQDDEQLHVTLRFVGEVDRPLAEDIATILSTVRFPAVELAIAGVGRFERRGRTHSVWAGVRPHEAITRLHHKVDQALVRVGLSPEGRAFLPHITLARMGASAGPVERYLADHAGLTTPPFRLEHFTLFESSLGHEGARYEAVARYALEGATV